MFHLYGEVTTTCEGLQSLTYTRCHRWWKVTSGVPCQCSNHWATETQYFDWLSHTLIPGDISPSGKIVPEFSLEYEKTWKICSGNIVKWVILLGAKCHRWWKVKSEPGLEPRASCVPCQRSYHWTIFDTIFWLTFTHLDARWHSALISIEQWGFFSVPHLLWHGASVYNGHHRGPVTLTPVNER